MPLDWVKNLMMFVPRPRLYILETSEKEYVCLRWDDMSWNVGLNYALLLASLGGIFRAVILTTIHVRELRT